MMIMSLAKFYRLTLNEGRMIISIQSEIDQIKAYIDIQKIKFGERLNVSYDIDEAVLCYDTIKFIMQPFVENVLEHAWYQEKMHIRIMAYKEDECICIKIIDNGIGMSKERLKQALIDNETRKGYGMFNVENRIKLQFGENYGVNVSSIPGGGTTVLLNLPCYKDKRG
jgi:sensor histidine kinase YesM